MIHDIHKVLKVKPKTLDGAHDNSMQLMDCLCVIYLFDGEIVNEVVIVFV